MFNDLEDFCFPIARIRADGSVHTIDDAIHSNEAAVALAGSAFAFVHIKFDPQIPDPSNAEVVSEFIRGYTVVYIFYFSTALGADT